MASSIIFASAGPGITILLRRRSTFVPAIISITNLLKPKH